MHSAFERNRRYYHIFLKTMLNKLFQRNNRRYSELSKYFLTHYSIYSITIASLHHWMTVIYFNSIRKAIWGCSRMKNGQISLRSWSIRWSSYGFASIICMNRRFWGGISIVWEGYLSIVRISLQINIKIKCFGQFLRFRRVPGTSSIHLTMNTLILS